MWVLTKMHTLILLFTKMPISRNGLCFVLLCHFVSMWPGLVVFLFWCRMSLSCVVSNSVVPKYSVKI